MLGLFTRAFERLMAAFAVVAATLILLMSLWISIDVLLRNIWGIGKPWFFDLSEYTLVWVTFLGAPWVLLQDRHVRIEILVDVLPVHIQRAIGITVSIIAICICAVLSWRTGLAALQYMQNEIMMPRIWRIPRIWPYSVVPIGSAMLTITFAIRLLRYVNERDPEARFKQAASAGQLTGTENKA